MNAHSSDLQEMKAAIENIERQALQLKATAAAMPVVEKNIQIILSAVHNLKFGIVDPAEVMDQ